MAFPTHFRYGGCPPFWNDSAAFCIMPAMKESWTQRPAMKVREVLFPYSGFGRFALNLSVIQSGQSWYFTILLTEHTREYHTRPCC